MTKAPAFQFYPADWRKDSALQMCSMATQGIWINLLCAMWEREERGKVSGTVEQFCRLLGCTKDEFENFLRENDVQNFARVTICNENVTIENRRMVREEKARNDAKNRVSRCRNAKVTAMKQICNENVTLYSSSSSSSSYLNNNSNADANVTKALQKQEEKTANYQPNFTGIEVNECDAVCDAWNDFAVHKVSDADRLGMSARINTALLRLGLTMQGLLETVGNYRQAVTARGSKAKLWTLGRWLDRGMDNYRPGYFAMDNYVWTERDEKPLKELDV